MAPPRRKQAYLPPLSADPSGRPPRARWTVSSFVLPATVFLGACLLYARGLPFPLLSGSHTSPATGRSSPLDPVFSMLGPYSPWLSQHSDISDSLPAGCEIDQVTILQRHGARYPTDGANDLIQNALAKLENVDTAALPSTSPFKFIDKFTFTDFEPGSLTDFGRKEAFDAGRSYARRYHKLAKNNLTWVRASDQERVVDSARFFMHGFAGRSFKLGNVSALPQVDTLVSEAEGLDNSLSVYTCTADNALDPHPGDIAETEWLETYGPAIADRVNKLLPGASLSPVNILSLMSLCGFASVRDVKLAKSPWCDAFPADEWRLNDYYYDVSKYYAHSFGSPFGKIKGASYVNELVARLTDSSHVVQAGATNISTVSPPGGERIFVDFSHDNTMVEILAALEMLKDAVHLPTQPSPPLLPPHTFHVSSMVPFSGRFVFERVTCPSRRRSRRGTRTFVRTMVNDAILGNGHPHGLVPLDDFLDRVAFAQGGGDWAKCLVDAQP